MKPENKVLYCMNISFIGELPNDHQIDDNFMKLWNKISEKYEKKSKTTSAT